MPTKKAYTIQLTQSNPMATIELDFDPNTLSISNTTKYPMFVNIGTVSMPSRTGFHEVIGPFSAYTADARGLRQFAVRVDNTADPSTQFAFPVVVTLSEGAASVQSPLSEAFLSSVETSAYIAKVLTVQGANLLELWGLNDETGIIALARKDVARNGVYVNAPALATLQGPDNILKAPNFNGTDEYVDVITPSLQGAIGAAYTLGSMMIWVQPGVANWNLAGNRTFFRVSAVAAGQGVAELGKATGAAYFVYNTSSGGVTVPVNNNWCNLILTWNVALNRIRRYVNGVKDGGDTALTTWNTGTPNVARVGANHTPAQFAFGGLSVAALWNVELAQADITILATAP